MTPITALVADDEDAPREALLAALATTWPALHVLARCGNGVDAWDAFLEHEPQVCFLDIRMPGLTGIEVAQRIGGRAAVVFVTAHGDHALAAFDSGAVDYVLKPIEPARLAQAVARVQQRLQGSLPPPAAMHSLLADLAQRLHRTPWLRVVQAAIGREVRLIRTDDVLYFESDSRYTRVVTATGDALIRTPLKELIGQLDPAQFWQVHRSVIVNQQAVASAVRVDEGTMHLVLRDRPERLPVSRHFQGLFRGQ